MSKHLDSRYLCNPQTRRMSRMVMMLIDEVVLTRLAAQHEPKMSIELRGQRGSWCPMPRDTDDWEYTQLIVLDMQLPRDRRELVCCAEVIPGIVGVQVERRPKGPWKTVMTLAYDVDAAHDNRSVMHMSMFPPPEPP
jgi:hypothetical protein